MFRNFLNQRQNYKGKVFLDIFGGLQSSDQFLSSSTALYLLTIITTFASSKTMLTISIFYFENLDATKGNR